MTTIVYDAKNNTLSGDRQCIVDTSSWTYYNTDGQKVFISPDRKIAFGSTGSNYGPAEVETFFKDIRAVLDLYYKTRDSESLTVSKVWGSLMNRCIMIFTKDHLFTRRTGEDLTILDMSQSHTVGSGRLTALTLLRANEKLNLGLSMMDIYKAVAKTEHLTGEIIDTIDLNQLIPYVDIPVPEGNPHQLTKVYDELDNDKIYNNDVAHHPV